MLYISRRKVEIGGSGILLKFGCEKTKTFCGEEEGKAERAGVVGDIGGVAELSIKSNTPRSPH